MSIIYEVNPPRVIANEVLSHEQLQNSVRLLKSRIVALQNLCHGIHITDSVLGVPRVSPITMGSLIRNDNKKLKITASLRVRDRAITALTQSFCDATLLGLNGILVLKGDAPQSNSADSNLVPSQVVKHFVDLGFKKKFELYLSLPTNPDFNKIQKKIEAQPSGFITQVVSSEEQVTNIVDRLKPQGFKIIPCILLPSTKNQKSADFLNLDWSGYKDNVSQFIKNIYKIAGDVLITSPNDFNAGQDTLSKLLP